MFDKLTTQIVAFRDERDWKQFHSPRNLAASISIEAAELLELFQWSSDASLAEDIEARRADLERKLADVVIYAMLLAHDTGVDLETAIAGKLAENAEKYPAEEVRRVRITRLLANVGVDECVAVVADARPGAVSFYEQFGFEPVILANPASRGRTHS